MIRCPGVINCCSLSHSYVFTLWKILDDLKGVCTCTTRLWEIAREVAWLATVVARIIQIFPVLTQDQSCVVFCSSFLLSKVLYHALVVLESSSTPAIFISWLLLVSPDSRLCADKKVQCWGGCDGILVPAHVVSVPQYLQQETITLSVSAHKETHCLYLVNLDLLLIWWLLVSRNFDELIDP